MNEMILVEFIDTIDNAGLLKSKIEDLEKTHNFNMRPSKNEYFMSGYFYFYARMESSVATLIRLKDPYLAERMTISYISDELKDHFRR